MKNVAGNNQPAAVGEVRVVTFTVKQVNLVTVRLCMEHALLREMICWPLPFQSAFRKPVSVLLC